MPDDYIDFNELERDRLKGLGVQMCERCDQRGARYFLMQGRYVCTVCYGGEDVLRTV